MIQQASFSVNSTYVFSCTGLNSKDFTVSIYHKFVICFNWLCCTNLAIWRLTGDGSINNVFSLQILGLHCKINFTGIWDCYNFKNLKKSRYAISSDQVEVTLFFLVLTVGTFLFLRPYPGSGKHSGIRKKPPAIQKV